MIDTPTALKSPSIKGKEGEYISNVLYDYWICLVSREVSILGRKEVLTGKAKFGILGDGKELPQVAMARAFKKGDWRSGYYRDQTFMMAKGLCSVEDYFAQLYADAENDPWTGGRQMNAHFCSPSIDSDDNWLDHKKIDNISCDISSTAGQMGRALGLAMASKAYRNNKVVPKRNKFSKNGNEVSFVTIGDASTSEGAFWETINAACVTKVPLVVAVWDDGYGISVPIKYQTTKGSISKALEGFLIDDEGNGMYIYTVKAWDYPALCSVFEKATERSREEHIPVLVHVQEVTQPQGHSTSGSHERYKSKERLQWELDMDCIVKMESWMLETGIIDENMIVQYREEAKVYVRDRKNLAWQKFSEQSDGQKDTLNQLLEEYKDLAGVEELIADFRMNNAPVSSEIIQLARRLKFLLLSEGQINDQLENLISSAYAKADKHYHSHLVSETDKGALNIPVIQPEYSDDSETLNGYQILNQFFDSKLKTNPYILAFGEDVGYIGDVNQGFAGLQDKHGVERVFDTGIREWTIMGQAIGLAMRGLRPIAEIQYLDYLIYGHSPLSDDLATLRYRSNNNQCAPAIIRTRGHRLEGIWHAGSPMGMLIHSLRGMHILVPRNMVQAAGFYNTLLQSMDPALVIECLNGYRLKEKMPDNLGEYTVPIGVPEILQEGRDVTFVTYGSCVRIAEKGIELLKNVGISVELIDAQSLLPFDLESIIASSVEKTNALIVMDEDVPGGASAYMMQQILERDSAFKYLDSEPITITAKDHRPPYGSDGDYYSKPNPEDVFEAVYKLMLERDPSRF